MSILKWAIALAILLLLTCATNDPRCGSVVCGKILEGLAGGAVFGLLSALSQCERLRSQRLTFLPLAFCLIRRELRSGLVGGLLVGLVLALLVMAAG